MMNVLFDVLGWKGPRFMQFTRSIMEHLPVVCTKEYYMEEGKYTLEPSVEAQKMLETYQNVQYYLHYKSELAG